MRIQSLMYHAEMKALQATVLDHIGVMFRAQRTYGNWSDQEEDAICQLFVIADRQFELSKAAEDWIEEIKRVIDYHFIRGTSDEIVEPLLKILGGSNKVVDHDGSAGKTDPESKSDEASGTRFSYFLLISAEQSYLHYCCSKSSTSLLVSLQIRTSIKQMFRT